MTKEELWQTENESKDKFVELRKMQIQGLIRASARNQKRTCEVPYHPLLDPFFEELMKGGLKIESRTLDKITLSWLT